MSQWFTLFQKELLEMWRNYKWIWVPITYILLGVSEPLTTYYMPQLIKSFGGLPEGAVFEIPPPTAAEVYIQGLSQYSTIGILVIVLSTMGIIASERKSGVAAMILVKPVSYFSFVTAKWAGGFLLLWLSLLIGSISTWYYTGILFAWIPTVDFIQSFLLYGLWLSVVLTLTVFFSAALMTPGIAGFLSLAIVIIFSIISGSLSTWLDWSPVQLTSYGNEVLLSKAVPKQILPTGIIAFASIIVLLLFSVFIFRKKELAS
jgi:ABC-2 type transport system permease protein